MLNSVTKNISFLSDSRNFFRPLKHLAETDIFIIGMGHDFKIQLIPIPKTKIDTI